MIKLKSIIKESYEMIISNTSQLGDKVSTPEEFMKGFIGKKLKDLLDAGSFCNLYIMNKYGMRTPDEDDIQALVNQLLLSANYYINFRKLDVMSQQRDKYEKIIYNTPEYNEWWKKRSAAIKNVILTRQSGNKEEYEKAIKEKDKIQSEDPTSEQYRKMKGDLDALVTQWHNTPLTANDVLPNNNDTDKDKERWENVKKAFYKFKQARS